jgi:hypothetical protein
MLVGAAKGHPPETVVKTKEQRKYEKMWNPGHGHGIPGAGTAFARQYMY